MHDECRTLTSPLSSPSVHDRELLGLTIVWHPDPARIGEQFVTGAQGAAIELSRYAPLFCHPGGTPLPLDYSGVSREPLRVERDGLDNVLLQLPASRMVVELNGKVISGAVHLDSAQVGAGRRRSSACLGPFCAAVSPLDDRAAQA